MLPFPLLQLVSRRGLHGRRRQRLHGLQFRRPAPPRRRANSRDLWLKLNLGALALFPFLFDGTFTLIRRAHLLLTVTQPPPPHSPLTTQNSPLTLPNSSFINHPLARLSELTQAHRSHLYQRWTQCGASHRKVAIAYTAWAALGAATALLVHFRELSLLLAYPIVLVPAAALLLNSRHFPK